jgi:transposase-like protein
MKEPMTLTEAVVYFSDPDRAHAHFVEIRWPHGAACPRQGCGSMDVRKLSRQRWRCSDCKRDFTAKVGTIFEDSPLGLDKWLPAIWLLANAKNGISSMELHRALGVTQKTAWHMLHRVRAAMKIRSFDKLQGDVEIDETFVGGKLKNRRRPLPGPSGNKRVGPVGKTPVLGLIERDGSARAFVVPDVKKKTLVPNIVANVAPESTIYTDSLQSYRHLGSHFRGHAWVDHAFAYVQGKAHVNSVESFWALLKRGLRGTYIATRPFHLDKYVDEAVFRWNGREGNDGTRFRDALMKAEGTRLTYRDLKAANTQRRSPRQ